MRIAAIVVILIACAAVINGIREGANFPLPRTLPGMGGPERPAEYEWGGVALLLMALWGWGRLRRSGQDDS